MKYIEPFNNFEMISENKKYEHINFIPPKTVSNQAKKGLKYRSKYKSIPNELAVKIARKLQRRDKITPSKVKQMATFFSRRKSRELLDSTGNCCERCKNSYHSY